MKKFLLILSFFIALIVGAIFLIALPHAEETVENHLKNLGYGQAKVQKSNIGFTGLTFPQINLDADGFNQIENLKVTLFWPRYILERQIDNIDIETLKLSFIERDFRRALRKMRKIDDFFTLPANNIRLKNIEISVSAGRKALMFSGSLQITHRDQKHYLNGTLSGDQYDIRFDSQWSGLIDQKNQILEIDGNFENLNLKSNNIKINRGSGWLSYHAKSTDNILNAQFDAGSGQVLQIPANDISLVLGQNNDSYPILFRAKASGIQGVHLNADYNYHPMAEQRTFQSTLNIPNLAQFVSYLETLDLIQPSANTLDSPLHLSMIYDGEKRFPGGPLPFTLRDKEDLEGTILFYPNSYEVRGTIQAEENLSTLLTDIFNIPPENINGTIIRLDNNIESFLD